MRIIVAELSVNYEGRGKTELPKAVRSIIIKEDGSLLIHNEKGFKPINYMTKIDEQIEENINGEIHLLFINKKEKLEIIIHTLIEEHYLNLDIDDPPIIREQTETDLQLYVSENISKLNKNYKFISREFETGFGPVDIFAEDVVSGNKIAMEIKRNATMNSIYQVLRYVDSLEEKGYSDVIPVVAALSFGESAISLAESRNVQILLIPEDWTEKILTKEKTIFDIWLVHGIDIKRKRW